MKGDMTCKEKKKKIHEERFLLQNKRKKKPFFFRFSPDLNINSDPLRFFPSRILKKRAEHLTPSL